MIKHRELSAHCAAKLAEWEGERLFAYPDPASPLAIATRSRELPWGFRLATDILAELPQTVRALAGDPWTVGIGHTGRDVTADLTITHERSSELFAQDTAWARKCVQDSCPEELTDNQFGAVVSLCFNIGADAFRGSTACKVANGRSPMAMRTALAMWVNVNHVPNAGLRNRRNHEADLWEEPEAIEA